ncbi:hypothetical protein CLI64_15325 [Nostoc sp. CENA543]|uniref:hypothetical protein n=1 Tax=Nostoc sp. CENA543 TaxID=1869241 RepID=UPI000CA3D6FB|nr:hypothetical protein [Nostoc sp. CENA543]AUT01646.1 hypothetical protein CLI64_15325 [Nostoc sp. CENA543]
MWFLPIINTGLDIISSLVNGFNNREQQKLAIIEYEKQARLEMEKLQIASDIDRQTKEHNLLIMKGIIDIMQNIVKTDVELNIIAKKIEAALNMQIGDWLLAKRKEICDLNNEQIRQLNYFLNRAKELNESDQEKFKSIVYENFEYNQKIIIDNNNFLVNQAEELAAKSGVKVISIKEEFKHLLGVNTLKLLENFEDI